MSRLTDLAATVADLGDEGALRDDELVQAVRDWGELRRLIDAGLARAIGVLDERCVSRAPETPAIRRGYRGPDELVAAEAGVDPVTARTLVRVGTAVVDRVGLTGEILPPVHPHVSEALAAGDLSSPAADRIVSTLDSISSFTAPEHLDRLEQTLVAVAPGLSTRDLKLACRRVIDLADPDGVEPRENDLRTRSSLTMQELEDGMTRVIALLHPEAAGWLKTALNARTSPSRTPTFAGDVALAPDEDPADPRTLARRRADALAGIARDALALDTGSVAGTPATVVVTMTLDQLQGAGGAAQIAGIDVPVSAGTARRMAAGAQIIPMVLGGESEILDQGRAARIATPAQRRALAVRDHGCIWGDGVPPGWCETAHRHPWYRGGPTDLDNLFLACPFHHWLYDTEGWDLEWRGTVPYLIPPAHVDPYRTPRRAGPVPAIA